MAPPPPPMPNFGQLKKEQPVARLNYGHAAIAQPSPVGSLQALGGSSAVSDENSVPFSIQHLLKQVKLKQNNQPGKFLFLRNSN
jgi:hypothetical protein